MYKSNHAKDGSLKHSSECKMAFGRKDKECPRCQELLKGAQTRNGWQKDYYANKSMEASRSKQIKNENYVLGPGIKVILINDVWYKEGSNEEYIHVF